MTSYVRSADVDLAQNSKFVEVNDSANIGNIKDGWGIFVNEKLVGIARTVNTGANPQTIELHENYTGNAITGGVLYAVITQGSISAIGERLTSLADTYEGLADSVATTTTPNSLVKRTSDGRVKVANGVDSNDAVAYGQFSGLEQDLIDTVDLQVARVNVEEKLKRDAAFYADFTQDDAIISSGLSKVASGVASAITMTNPDGITGIGADGKIYDSGAGNVPIVHDVEGECQGLQTATGSTNEWLWSEDITTGVYSIIGGAAINSETFIENSNDEQHRLSQNITVTSQGDLWSFHGEFKPNGRSVIQLVLGSNIFPTTSVNFDLENVVISDDDGGFDHLKIEKRADGWVYCEAVCEASEGSGITSPFWVLQDSPTASRFSSYLGDGSSGIKARYLSAEQGYPTAYIKTEASQVTRGYVGAVTEQFGLNPVTHTLFGVATYYGSEDDQNLLANRSGDTGFDVSLTTVGSIRTRYADGSGGTVNTLLSMGLEIGDRFAWCVTRDSDGVVKTFCSATSNIETLTGSVDAEFTDKTLKISAYTASGSVRPANGTVEKIVVSSHTITDAEALVLTSL
jgi:hypothetical protein